jgi:hypothetical protein
MARYDLIGYRRDDGKYQARVIHEAFCKVVPRESGVHGRGHGRW